jgi:hypothetical protein
MIESPVFGGFPHNDAIYPRKNGQNVEENHMYNDRLICHIGSPFFGFTKLHSDEKHGLVDCIYANTCTEGIIPYILDIL